MAACPGAQIKISPPSRYRISRARRSYCEFNDVVDAVFDARGVDCETVCRSDRDDWLLAHEAMTSAWLGDVPLVVKNLSDRDRNSNAEG